MASELSILAALVTSSVQTIESQLAAHKPPVSFPSHAAPYNPASPEEIALADPSDFQLQNALSLLASASFELLIRARKPVVNVLYGAVSYITSSALGVVLEFNLVEVLKEAGPEGLSTEEIGKRAGGDATKLSRVLRYLVSQGIFVELRPDVFANNRLSTILDTGLNLKDIKANPDLLTTTPSAAMHALCSHLTDEGAKAGAYFANVVKDPEWGPSGEPGKAAASKSFEVGPGFGTVSVSGKDQGKSTEKDVKWEGLTAWEIYDQPGQEHRSKRFNLAMEGAKRAEPEAVSVAGIFPTLPPSSTIVDVGGGTGSVSLSLAKAYPHLEIIIQDRENVVEEGVKRWKEEFPEAIESGRVKFEAQDFFLPQKSISPNAKSAQGAPIVFFLKSILHDWHDSYSVKILKQLRDAASANKQHLGRETKLVVLDKLVPYMSKGSEYSDVEVEGLIKAKLPDPLPANLGGGYYTPYMLDLNMLILLNGQERTLGQMQKLFSESGWKLERVFQLEGFGLFGTQIVAVPV